MKIAVVCANGKAGKLIVKETVERGLDVTAVVRRDNQTAAQNVLKKDLFDLTAADLKGFDVVIDAFGAWTEDVLSALIFRLSFFPLLKRRARRSQSFVAETMYNGHF